MSILKKYAEDLLLGLLYSVALVACLIDSYKNPGTVQKYFYVSSVMLFSAFLVVALFLRVKTNYRFPDIVNQINQYLIFPFASLMFIVLSLIDYYRPINYVFNRLLINYQELGFLAIGSGLFALMSLDNAWWKENYKRAIFILPLFIYITCLHMSLWPFDFFTNLNLEDHFIENTQFFILLMSGLLSLVISKYLFRKSVLFGLFYVIIGISLLFVAGDEIAWGQRIIGLQTPENIRINNYQGEITVHNLRNLSQYTWIGYMVVSLYGAFGWILGYLTPRKWRKYLIFFTVPWFASSYFVFSLIYHSIAKPWVNHGIGVWSETTEMVMYLGIFFYLLFIYLAFSKFLPKDQQL